MKIKPIKNISGYSLELTKDEVVSLQLVLIKAKSPEMIVLPEKNNKIYDFIESLSETLRSNLLLEDILHRFQ